MKNTHELGSELENEVLFQKLGSTWYIFTEIDDQIVYSSMPEGMDPRSTKLELYDIIENHMKKVAAMPKYRAPEAI